MLKKSCQIYTKKQMIPWNLFGKDNETMKSKNQKTILSKINHCNEIPPKTKNCRSLLRFKFKIKNILLNTYTKHNCLNLV